MKGFAGSHNLKFHQNHCPGVNITDDDTLATWRTRKPGNLRMAFSSRPILRNEKIYVRVMENSVLKEKQPEIQKKATFCFTTFDPEKLTTAAGQLELHMIDIGYLMTENNLKRGGVYTFWIGDDGQIYRGGDSEKDGPVPGMENLIPPDQPIWFAASSRGNITLKFVGEMTSANGRSPITFVYPDLANAFAHIMHASAEDRRESQLQSLQ